MPTISRTATAAAPPTRRKTPSTSLSTSVRTCALLGSRPLRAPRPTHPVSPPPQIDTSGAIKFEYFTDTLGGDTPPVAQGFQGPGVITEESLGLEPLLDKAGAQPLAGSNKLTVTATALLVGNGMDNPQVLDDVLLNPEMCYLYDICPSIETPVGFPPGNVKSCTVRPPPSSSSSAGHTWGIACTRLAHQRVRQRPESRPS